MFFPWAGPPTLLNALGLWIMPFLAPNVASPNRDSKRPLAGSRYPNRPRTQASKAALRMHRPINSYDESKKETQRAIVNSARCSSTAAASDRKLRDTTLQGRSECGSIPAQGCVESFDT